MKGTALWTALPNGFTDDGMPKLSVMVAPRFDDLSGADPLGPFADWPAAIGKGPLRFTIQVEGGARLENQTPLHLQDPQWLSSASLMWAAAFRNYLRPNDDKAVATLGPGFKSKDFAGHILSSYDSKTLSDFFKQLYGHQNAAAGLLKSPVREKAALAAERSRFETVKSLANGVGLRLAPNASEQQKL